MRANHALHGKHIRNNYPMRLKDRDGVNHSAHVLILRFREKPPDDAACDFIYRSRELPNAIEAACAWGHVQLVSSDEQSYR